MKKNVKIGKYLAKIWTKYDSFLFLGHPVHTAYSSLEVTVPNAMYNNIVFKTTQTQLSAVQ